MMSPCMKLMNYHFKLERVQISVLICLVLTPETCKIK